MTVTNTVSTTIDALLSSGTHTVSTTIDALLTKKNRQVTTTIDAKLSRQKTVTIDALIVESRGQFRGTFTTTERDALTSLQAQDTIINTTLGQQQYWTGSAWLSAGSLASPGSGQTQNLMAPTTAGWRSELGDPTYPIRYWNGSTAKFTVDNAGNVVVTGSVTAGSFVGGSIDIPSVGGTGFHVDSSGNVGTGGTTATDSASPFLVTAAGLVSARNATLYPQSNATSALTLNDDKSTTAALTEWQLAGTAKARVMATGALRTLSSYSVYAALADTNAKTLIDGNSLAWGAGGASSQDVVLSRYTTSGNGLHVSALSSGAGIYFQMAPMTAPATPPVSQWVRLYDEAGVLKWKNSSGTVFDLSAFSTTTIATDTLWDALGDLVYGSAADMGAKLAGNTTSTKKFLAQTGTGTVSAAPAWSTIDLSSADVTGILAAARFPALTGDVTTSSGAVATTIANDAVTYAKFQNIATDSLLGRDTAGTGDPENILLNATLSMDGGGNLQRAALTGDVTAPAGSNATTLAAGSASNLNSGTLPAGRLPALTGDVTSSAGSAATTLAAGNAGNLNSGTLLAARMPAHTGDVTSSAGSVALTLAAGSASVLNSGTLLAARMPALTGDVTTSAGAVATTIAAAAVTLAKMANIATDSLIGRDTAGTGVPESILLNATLSMDGSGNLQRAALTGDVTASAGSNATTLAAGSASNLNSGTLPAGRLPALTGDVTTSAGTAATTLAAGSASNLNSGTLAAGRMPALTGDVTTSAGAVATTIANNAVTYPKIQNVAATSRFLGRITTGAGVVEELTAANAKTILALQASDLSDNSNLAKLNAGNTFTIGPQTITVDAASHQGLVINLAASQTGRAIQVTDSDGVAAFQMAGSGADILATQYAADPIIAARQAAGTNLVPTATPADTIMLEVGGRGYGTSFEASSRAAWRFYTAELHSATAQGSYIDAVVVKKGTTARTFPFRFTDDAAFRMQEVAAPASPASGYTNLYSNSTDSLLHYIDDGGRDNPIRPYQMVDPGSMSLPTGSYFVQWGRTTLSGSERITMAGTARWNSVDFASTSGSIALAGTGN